jgi:hypothetical protein
MVLMEGASAGGVTVSADNFDLFDPAPESAAAAAADQVIRAILETRESAAESGLQLRSSGVTWTDPLEADALRDALAAHKIENVMLVSAFMAAAALAQAVGSATNCARTALLFVEPTTATLAIVDSSDGSIADVHRRPLREGDGAVVAELTTMISSVEAMEARPQSVFLVGSGVDIPLIKPALEASTSLWVTAPEEPETALARGAALASANSSLGAPPTVVLPRVPAPTSRIDPGGLNEDDLAAGLRPRSRRRFVLAMSAMAILVGGVVALALALALGIRPHADQPATPPPSAVPPPVSAAPSQAPTPVVPQPGPISAPPQQGPPLHPRGDDHGGGGWLHRHLEDRGVLGP